MSDMRQVTKSEFFAAIFDGNLDVHPRIVEPWPYTRIFEFRDRREFGRIVEHGHGTENGYYLAEARA